ncbi:hypothetical protein [Luteolibacter yonseiensis]|nr:hypothetical protein [Luteolibacter yonseiensis]
MNEYFTLDSLREFIDKTNRSMRLAPLVLDFATKLAAGDEGPQG